MKRLFALLVLALTVSTSAFASDVVGRGVKGVAKGSAKAVTVTAKASVHVVKFLF